MYEWVIGIAILCSIMGVWQMYKFWRQFNQLEIGTKMSRKFVNSSMKSLKMGITWFVIGGIFGIVSRVFQ